MNEPSQTREQAVFGLEVGELRSTLRVRRDLSHAPTQLCGALLPQPRHATS